MFTLFRAANVFVVAICFLAHAGAAEPPRLVHVTGYGAAKVAPDEVVIRLTLTTVAIIRTNGKPRGIAFDAASGAGFIANEEGWVDLVV